MRNRLVPLLAALSFAACADGGEGEGGAGGQAPDSCPVLPTGRPVVGAAVDLEAAPELDVPRAGERPAIATNGTLHLALWWSGSSLFFARLDAAGAPLDRPARLLASQAQQGASSVAWDGERFLAAWLDGDALHRARLSIEGVLEELATTQLPPRGREFSPARLTIGAQGVVLLVWGTEDGPEPTRPFALLATRISGDGTPLDAAPIVLVDTAERPRWEASTIADGSEFVIAWGPEIGLGELRATRLSAAGVLSAPGGVLLAADGGPVALLRDDAELLVAWVSESRALQLARLSPSLEPTGAGPVLVTTVDPQYEGFEGLRLSRSDDGQLALQWRIRDDTSIVTAFVQALDDDLRGRGAVLSQQAELEELDQELVGLAGAGHLVVRTGALLTAALLESGAGGLTEGPSQPISLGAGTQRDPVLAGNGTGYLALWSETTAAGERTRGRLLDGEGLPGAALDLGESGEVRVAPSGDGYLVAHRALDFRLELTMLGPDGTQRFTAAIEAEPRRPAFAVACLDGRCLVAWSRREDHADVLYGVRFGPAGERLDPAPLLLATAPRGGLGELALFAIEGAYRLYWAGGAARVDPLTGSVELRDGLPEEEEGPTFEGLPIAAGGDMLLAVRTRRDPGATSEQWVELFELDGGSLGTTAAGGWFGPPHAAWDGTGFLFSAGERSFLVEGVPPLQTPEALTFEAGAFALACRSPGRCLAISARVRPEFGTERLFLQPIDRPDADVCRAFPP